MRRSALHLIVLASVACAAGCMMVGPSPDGAARAKESPVASARLERAVALAAQGRYGPAAERLAPLADEFGRAGDRDRAAEALFWLGFCREKDGRPEEAAALYRRVVQDYPRTRAAELAGDRLGRLAARPAPD